jgi:hypothetical protein
MTSRLGPIKRRDFVRKLRALGFDGPEPGGRHEIMTYRNFALAIPSNSEYSPAQHRELLREVGTIFGREITRDEWTRLKIELTV